MHGEGHVNWVFLRFFQGLPLLAEDAPPPQADTTELLLKLLPFIAIGVLFYFLMIRPQRREQSRRQTMLDAVQKNDHVVTIGGVYGVVTNVHREADEVTLKVDEATNTKLRVTLSSIARVIREENTEAPSTP
jgi:preprotein translocase subunit YajC